MTIIDAPPLDEISQLKQRLESAERDNARLTAENERLSRRCSQLGSLVLIDGGVRQTVAELVHFLETAPTECTIDFAEIVREVEDRQLQFETSANGN